MTAMKIVLCFLLLSSAFFQLARTMLISRGELDPKMVACIERNDAEGLEALIHAKETVQRDPQRVRQETLRHVDHLREHIVGFPDPTEEYLAELDEKMIDEYWSINNVNQLRSTLLHEACTGRGKTDVLRVLLKHPKIEVNTPNPVLLHTALRTAVDTKAYDVMKILLADPRVDVNFKDHSGYSCLYWARSKGDLYAMKLLIASGRVLDPLSPQIRYETGPWMRTLPPTETDEFYDEFVKNPERVRLAAQREVEHERSPF